VAVESDWLFQTRDVVEDPESETMRVMAKVVARSPEATVPRATSEVLSLQVWSTRSTVASACVLGVDEPRGVVWFSKYCRSVLVPSRAVPVRDREMSAEGWLNERSSIRSLRVSMETEFAVEVVPVTAAPWWSNSVRTAFDTVETRVCASAMGPRAQVAWNVVVARLMAE
jgi:hypothetical protein